MYVFLQQDSQTFQSHLVFPASKDFVTKYLLRVLHTQVSLTHSQIGLNGNIVLDISIFPSLGNGSSVAPLLQGNFRNNGCTAL